MREPGLDGTGRKDRSPGAPDPSWSAHELPPGPAALRALTSCSSMSAPRLERTKPRSGRSSETEAPAPCAGLLVRVLTLAGNSAIAAPLPSRGRCACCRRPSRGGCRLLRRCSLGGSGSHSGAGRYRRLGAGSGEPPGAAGTRAPPTPRDTPP